MKCKQCKEFTNLIIDHFLNLPQMETFDFGTDRENHADLPFEIISDITSGFFN